MDSHELISFLRSMARMQAEMPEQYAKMLDMIEQFKVDLVSRMVNADMEKTLFRCQGGINSVQEILDRLSTPSQDLQNLEKS
jgi:hypothetical protein